MTLTAFSAFSVSSARGHHAIVQRGQGAGQGARATRREATGLGDAAGVREAVHMRHDHAACAAVQHPRDIRRAGAGDPPEHRQTRRDARRRGLPKLAHPKRAVLHVDHRKIESRAAGQKNRLGAAQKTEGEAETRGCHVFILHHI